MSDPTWFRPRGYRHFDAPVSSAWAADIDPTFVSKHSWSPLIHQTKITKRYKPLNNKTEPKKRDIMFASHRDACILTKYSWSLGKLLEDFYRKNSLSDSVIAYRSLGKANYHFAAEVQRRVREHKSIRALCFDITGFFDHLDHSSLKSKLKIILDVKELSPDWYKIYSSMTNFSRIAVGDIKKDPLFSNRLSKRHTRAPIATMSELVERHIPIHKNPYRYGIPQGTPISANMSNLYMINFDLKLRGKCDQLKALYRRYSDDILIVCEDRDALNIENFLLQELDKDKLKIKDKKQIAAF